MTSLVACCTSSAKRFEASFLGGTSLKLRFEDLFQVFRTMNGRQAIHQSDKIRLRCIIVQSLEHPPLKQTGPSPTHRCNKRPCKLRTMKGPLLEDAEADAQDK